MENNRNQLQITARSMSDNPTLILISTVESEANTFTCIACEQQCGNPMSRRSRSQWRV